MENDKYDLTTAIQELHTVTIRLKTWLANRIKESVKYTEEQDKTALLFLAAVQAATGIDDINTEAFNNFDKMIECPDFIKKSKGYDELVDIITSLLLTACRIDTDIRCELKCFVELVS